MRPFVAACAIACVLPAPASVARGLSLGFFDPVFAGGTADSQLWLQRARSEGSQVVRSMVPWATVAARRPAQPADPADPVYDWSEVDATVRTVTPTGETLFLDLTASPRWADASQRPQGLVGSWDPSPAAFASFARAAATRYSGSYPDPADPGATLPRVRYWQAWNEPNLQSNLNPQWRNGRPYTPQLYRRMLNGFYTATKTIHSDIKVVTAGLGPFGDRQVGGRIMPVRFWREMLRRKTTFDIWSHHPYAVRAPTGPALNRDDASIADVHKIRAVVERARRAGTLAGRHVPASWVTEVSYDSSPPDPNGVPARTHARWLEQTFYVLWMQRVSTITWFLIADMAPVPSFAATNQSGSYFRDGRPKLAATAFRFPFVTERLRKRLRLWGKAPAPGAVIIERYVQGHWATVKTVSAGKNRIFTSYARLPGPQQLRARQGAMTSLPWSQR